MSKRVWIARCKCGDEVRTPQDPQELRDPKFYSARTKRAVNSGGAP